MYTKLNFDKWFKRKVDNLTKQEFMIGPEGKLIPRAIAGARPTPWIFVSHDIRKKYCWFWNRICTQTFSIIPTHCRFNCWKTVIKPNNIKEQFECYNILKKLDLPSKIGSDHRDYTFGAWSGYIYADSLEEGRKYYKIVRECIPKQVDVILKRGCTEMEQLRSSDTWNEMAEEDLEIEKRLTDLFLFDERQYHQARWHKNEIMENWIKRAIELGDPYAKEMAINHSGDPEIWNKLVVNSVTYHEEEPKPKTKRKKK